MLELCSKGRNNKRKQEIEKKGSAGITYAKEVSQPEQDKIKRMSKSMNRKPFFHQLCNKNKLPPTIRVRNRGKYETVFRRRTDGNGCQVRKEVNQGDISRKNIPACHHHRAYRSYRNAVFEKTRHRSNHYQRCRFRYTIRFLFLLGTFRFQNAGIHPWKACKGMAGVSDKRNREKRDV